MPAVEAVEAGENVVHGRQLAVVHGAGVDSFGLEFRQARLHRRPAGDRRQESQPDQGDQEPHRQEFPPAGGARRGLVHWRMQVGGSRTENGGCHFVSSAAALGNTTSSISQHIASDSARLKVWPATYKITGLPPFRY